MQKCCEQPSLQNRQIIKPSITELSREVRTNILCTVGGCGKILPNTPALNMHLVKSHRVKEGLVNPTIRKDLKASQKIYCCPVEGCPRGPKRPFSQFSLVKQHFMKMHAEKKHKCLKCCNSYSTEWDLRRHTEDCGRTYSCTCGCPYASRAALLSHTYRTGHEVPKEHRYLFIKSTSLFDISASSKRSTLQHNGDLLKPPMKPIYIYIYTNKSQCHTLTRLLLLLLCLKFNLSFKDIFVRPAAFLWVNYAFIQSDLHNLLITTLNTVSTYTARHKHAQGSVRTVHLLQPSVLNFKDTFPEPRPCPETISTGVQVNLEDPAFVGDLEIHLESSGKGTSTNIQTISNLNRANTGVGTVNVPPSCEVSVSSCSQTDITVSAQIQLPVSVQTQTLPSRIRALSSIGAQTDVYTFSSANVNRETQTSTSAVAQFEKGQLNQAICTDLFDTGTLSVSTQTSTFNASIRTSGLEDPLSNTDTGLFEDKTTASMCFRAQNDILHQNTVADNQTQTMILFRDLENILSDSLGAVSSSCTSGLVSVHEQQHASIDFDFEEFLNATHIQTQTEESGLNGLNTETTLELLDIETQTDFLLFDNLGDGHNSDVATRVQPNDLELEMFDTQTQTDLNFLLETSGHMPLSNILRQTSFSISTESSDTETQTDMRPEMLPLPCTHEGQARLSSAKTQTISSSLTSLGHRFHTSNETQTAVDDILSADLAWNVETQTFQVVEHVCRSTAALYHFDFNM
ncbi:ATM interactor [Triplophysa tibetana]|uniref:ATM interactor n=1 Tax=Triplophysa tibetana TaxID=1572043 RepID=A0A5A9NXS9_9TELE|nr:ATM interactor [Triplophysa tibetana]